MEEGVCRYDRVKDLEMGRWAWVIGWVQRHHRVLMRRRQEGQSQRGGVVMEAEVRESERSEDAAALLVLGWRKR